MRISDWSSDVCSSDLAPPFHFEAWRDVTFAVQQRDMEIGFEANIIENHDEPRGASRYLPEYAQNEMGKKMLATTSILLRGIPFIYQGCCRLGALCLSAWKKW